MSGCLVTGDCCRPQPIGGSLNKQLWAVFEKWEQPVLLAFGENDPVLGSADYMWRERCGFNMHYLQLLMAKVFFLSRCPGTRGQPHVTLSGAGHFSQDGGGEQLVAAVIGFIQETSAALQCTSKL